MAGTGNILHGDVTINNINNYKHYHQYYPAASTPATWWQTAEREFENGWIGDEVYEPLFEVVTPSEAAHGKGGEEGKQVVEKDGEGTGECEDGETQPKEFIDGRGIADGTGSENEPLLGAGGGARGQEGSPGGNDNGNSSIKDRNHDRKMNFLKE